jgi:hypothetical protein
MLTKLVYVRFKVLTAVLLRYDVALSEARLRQANNTGHRLTNDVTAAKLQTKLVETV